MSLGAIFNSTITFDATTGTTVWYFDFSKLMTKNVGCPLRPLRLFHPKHDCNDQVQNAEDQSQLRSHENNCSCWICPQLTQRGAVLWTAWISRKDPLIDFVGSWIDWNGCAIEFAPITKGLPDNFRHSRNAKKMLGRWFKNFGDWTWPANRAMILADPSNWKVIQNYYVCDHIGVPETERTSSTVALPINFRN